MYCRRFLVVLYFPFVCGEFACPPAKEIEPCVCRTFPNVIVECNNVPSLVSVRAVLGHYFEPFLPRLKISNIHTFSLPPYALGDLSPKKLYLKDSNIRRIDGKAFEGQKSLQLLVLAEDRLEDIPSESLKSLTGLRTLSLMGNFLMKLRKDSFFGLDNVRSLILSDNWISEIDRKTFPRYLKSLALSRNHLSTFNGSLHYLKLLEELYARDNRLISIQGEFEGLDSLKYLYLDHNYINEISDGLKFLSSLVTLSISGNNLRSMKGIDISSLKFLNVSHNHIIEMNSKTFEKLRNLETLDLSGNVLKLSCIAMKPLRELRELRLSDINLKRLEHGCFKHMKYLTTLDLSQNHLKDLGPALFPPIPSWFSFPQSNHNELSSLTHGLKNLKELDISSNQFSFYKFHNLMENNRRLARIRIGGNPWNCSSQLFSVLEELLQNNITVEGYPIC